MKCPFCNAADTKVIDSRPVDDNSSIRRRRQCETCGKRFTTYEKLETLPLMVIKKGDTREAYDRSKLEAGIIRSCHKLQVSPQQIAALIDDIENQIFNREEREVPSSVIGELVMKNLKELDEVAYVRFASVYREFKDVNTFMEELGKIAHYDFESLAMTIFSSTFGYTFLNASFHQNLTKTGREEFIRNSVKIFVNGISER